MERTTAERGERISTEILAGYSCRYVDGTCGNLLPTSGSDPHRNGVAGSINHFRIVPPLKRDPSLPLERHSHTDLPREWNAHGGSRPEEIPQCALGYLKLFQARDGRGL